MERYFGSPIVPVRDKNASIPYDLLNPHYSDRRFTEQTGGKTVFLEKDKVTGKEYGVTFVQGANYEYSDRLVQWHGLNKVEEASKRAEETVGNTDSARYFEEYLRILQNQPELQLVHIISGVNQGDGYPYRVYGYIIPEKTSEIK